jgi:hypothetical protein
MEAKRRMAYLVAGAGVLVAAAACGLSGSSGAPWQEKFDLASCTMKTSGRNDYFVLEPGYQLLLESKDTRLQVTVTDDTKVVDGVTTRVVEEREWKDGKLYEVAKNYFAICEQTRDVYYFGEDVDFYDENGKITKHDGTWHAGTNGNRAGLMMPGAPKAGMRYYQEIAPGVAMDRAEIVSLEETCSTPAGSFPGCMKVREGSAIDLLAKEYKYHARGIGLVRDEDLRLVKHGFVGKSN